MPELEALGAEVQRLSAVEAQCHSLQRDLDAAKASLAESAQALVEWQAADKQHKELFGPLASLDPVAMASKLDDTLAELKLIRVRQEQVLEQQERVRLNAEKAQMQKELQEQKIKARQKANAEKAMQKYSAKPDSIAEVPARHTKTASPVGNAAASTASPPVAAKPAVAVHADEHIAVPEEESKAFFANAEAKVSVQRPNLRRTPLRAATQSPVPAEHMPQTPGQRSASAQGQIQSAGAETAAKQAAKPPLPVCSPAKLQNALQKALGQFHKT